MHNFIEAIIRGILTQTGMPVQEKGEQRKENEARKKEGTRDEE